MSKSLKVWSIYYRVRSHSRGKWTKYIGPCGVHILHITLPCEITDALRGRPFFFRTRKLARDMVKKLYDEKNTTWKWVQYTVRPIKLTYEPYPAEVNNES